MALLREDWTVRHDFLTIDLIPFLNSTSERLSDLAAAREMVVSSPDILGGTPVFRGTRVPVYDVAGSTTAGHPVDRILEAYPRFDAEKVRPTTIYAEANPCAGGRARATAFPRAPSSSPIAAFLASGRRDEIPDRWVPQSGVRQVCLNGPPGIDLGLQSWLVTVFQSRNGRSCPDVGHGNISQ